MLSLMLSLVSLPLAIAYYDSSKVKDENTSKIAWGAVYIVLPSSIVLILTSFMNIKKEYRKTFWSTKKSRDFILGYFDSTEDEIKAFVFINNTRYWKEIEGNVEKWVRDNWKRWTEEEPEWLDENTKSRIPPYMIPDISDRAKIIELQSKRKRTSFLGKTRITRVLPQLSKREGQ